MELTSPEAVGVNEDGTEATVDAERHDLLVEGLRLQEELRAVVLSKRAAMDDFLADLDARIARVHTLLEEEGA